MCLRRGLVVTVACLAQVFLQPLSGLTDCWSFVAIEVVSTAA
jgi:hypothetical protein